MGDGDMEWAEYVAWLDREIAAGRDPEPGPWAPDDGELRDLTLGETGPTLFAEGGDADVLPPSPLLAALTDQAVSDVTSLSDNELVGVLRATQRQMAREQFKQALAAAEFGRRRQAAFEDALRRGVPAGCAPGGFPGEELSVELTISRAEAAPDRRFHRPYVQPAADPGRHGRRADRRRPGRVDRHVHPDPWSRRHGTGG